MALVNLNGILGDARRGKYAVPAFDVSSYEMARAVVDVAEEVGSPVILMGLKPDLTEEAFDLMSLIMQTIARKAEVDVCIHLDHANEFDLIKKAIAQGYSSVMIDASQKPLEENIRITREITNYAHMYGVSVEAELGHVGDGIVGNSENAAKENGGHESTLTKPEDMERFIAETNVDALAVAIGTSHGVYKGTPKLDLQLMDELNRRSKVPLVMHGGSGTPEKDLVKSIELGMCKINIFSDILNGYYSGMKEFLNSTENLSIWPSAGNKKALESMKNVILEKYKLFGAMDKGRK